MDRKAKFLLFAGLASLAACSNLPHSDEQSPGTGNIGMTVIGDESPTVGNSKPSGSSKAGNDAKKSSNNTPP